MENTFNKYSASNLHKTTLNFQHIHLTHIIYVKDNIHGKQPRAAITVQEQSKQTCIY